MAQNAREVQQALFAALAAIFHLFIMMFEYLRDVLLGVRMREVCVAGPAAIASAGLRTSTSLHVAEDGSSAHRAGNPIPFPTKYYAVARGQRPSIYLTWPLCKEQVRGFPNAQYKSFPSAAEAEQFCIRERDHSVISY